MQVLRLSSVKCDRRLLFLFLDVRTTAHKAMYVESNMANTAVIALHVCYVTGNTFQVLIISSSTG